MQEKRRILVVEDEQAIRQGLCDVLTYHGFDVSFCENGEDALKLAHQEKFHLIVLDIMLPGRDGFSVCEELRRTDKRLPIVMLTAKSGEDDRILGLSLGADDYVAKPFSVRELVLRIEAVLRRSDTRFSAPKEILVGKGVKINTNSLTGSIDGEIDEIEFTRREVELLQYLLECNDRYCSRGELLTEVWGYQRASEIETRTVDIHIARLRRKIEPDPKNPIFLVTNRGEGYRLFPAKS